MTEVRNSYAKYSQRNDQIRSKPVKNGYEIKVFRYLEEHIKTLNLPASYKETAISIYRDILESMDGNSGQDKFDYFYEGLDKRAKAPRFVSASLILLILHKNKIRMTQIQLAKKLQISNKFSISYSYNSLLRLLEKLPEYQYIFKGMSARSVSKVNYKNTVEAEIREFYDILIKKTLINRRDIKEILDLLNRYIVEIIASLDGFKFKSPKYIASAICWIYLTHYKDIDISGSNFIEIINMKENCQISTQNELLKNTLNVDVGNFSNFVANFLQKIYNFDIVLYTSKVEYYIERYIDLLKKQFQILLSDKKIPSKIPPSLNSSFFNESMELYKNALKKGFEINYKAGNSQFYYYFPQTMAISLIFYVLRLKTDLQKKVISYLIENVIKSDISFKFQKRSMKYITDSENRIYPFIKDAIGHNIRQIYSKDSFIHVLRGELKKYYHLETDFLLRLYNLSNLKPYEFGNALNIHGGRGVSSILDIVDNKAKFTEPRTFNNIRNFIYGYIPQESQNNAFKWLENLKSTRHSNLRHGSITYSFKWIQNRFPKFLDGSLSQFFSNILKGNYPRHIFTDPQNSRASHLKFKGTTNEHVATDIIKNYFSKFLVNHNSKYYLCKYAQEVFDYYRDNKIGSKPDHQPIQNYILNEEVKALAMEIPVWKGIKVSSNGGNFMGHIDLLLIDNNTLIICDYKPKKWEIYKSLPQITAYAILLRKRLKHYTDMSVLKIQCIGFTKDCAAEWNPDILLPEIIKFVKQQNSIRATQLLNANRKIKRDLLLELEKLIS